MLEGEDRRTLKRFRTFNVKMDVRGTTRDARGTCPVSNGGEEDRKVLVFENQYRYGRAFEGAINDEEDEEEGRPEA